jgi:hypothetical protein
MREKPVAKRRHLLVYKEHRSTLWFSSLTALARLGDRAFELYSERIFLEILSELSSDRHLIYWTPILIAINLSLVI